MSVLALSAELRHSYSISSCCCWPLVLMTADCDHAGSPLASWVLIAFQYVRERQTVAYLRILHILYADIVVCARRVLLRGSPSAGLTFSFSLHFTTPAHQSWTNLGLTRSSSTMYTFGAYKAAKFIEAILFRETHRRHGYEPHDRDGTFSTPTGDRLLMLT